jgi:hypothetical protein
MQSINNVLTNDKLYVDFCRIESQSACKYNINLLAVKQKNSSPRLLFFCFTRRRSSLLHEQKGFPVRNSLLWVAVREHSDGTKVYRISWWKTVTLKHNCTEDIP